MVHRDGVLMSIVLIMTMELARRHGGRNMLRKVQTARGRWRGKTDRAAKQRHPSEKLPHGIHIGWIFRIISKRNRFQVDRFKIRLLSAKSSG